MIELEEKQSILENTLKNNPLGLNYKQLLNDFYIADTPEELSKIIHKCLQLGTVYKRDKIYFHVDVEIKQEENRESDNLKTIEKEITEIEQKNTTEDKEPVDRIMGSLRKTKGQGSIALACYLLRDKVPFINKEDLSKFVKDINNIGINQILNRLVTQGYILKEKISNNLTIYRWNSEKYIYPFSYRLSSDEELLDITISEFLNEKNISTEIKEQVIDAIEKEDKLNINNDDDMDEHIDKLINGLQLTLEGIRGMLKIHFKYKK